MRRYIVTFRLHTDPDGDGEVMQMEAPENFSIMSIKEGFWIDIGGAINPLASKARYYIPAAQVLGVKLIGGGGYD